MNRLRLKLIACLVFVFAVVVVGYVFWPDQTSITESRDAEYIQKDNIDSLQAQGQPRQLSAGRCPALDMFAYKDFNREPEPVEALVSLAQ